MVRLSVLKWSVATIALFGARPILASPINFTGFVENDFSKSDPSVKVINVNAKATDVGPSAFMVQNGWVSGWAVKDIRLSYNQSTDTLSVGVNAFKNGAGHPAIFGDADGNGDPGGASPQMVKAGGIDNASLGGHKSFAIAFAADKKVGQEIPGVPVLIAGVPADKSLAGTGTDHFTVAPYRNVDLGLGYNFGKALTGNVGNLAFDPSAAHPGLEFTINNFSKVSGFDPAKGVWIKAYAGSPDDVVVGESAIEFQRIPALGEQQIPEPATILGWSLVAGAAALRWRLRRPSTDQS